MRPFQLALISVLTLALIVPTATADHWSLYRAGIDPTIGETLEPDGAVWTGPGAGLEGRANKVTLGGGVPGDGGLFLDAIMGTPTAFGPHVYARPAGDATLGEPNVLIPGPQAISAWYGWWNDLDQDGVIADLHDGDCGTDLCAGDEFAWRGVVSDDTVALRAFITNQGCFGLPGNGPSCATHTPTDFVDHTSSESADQGWYGASATWPQATFLASAQMLVVAGATPVPGTDLGFDLDDSAALIDVDRYDSLSPDVELLWNAVLVFVDDASTAPLFDAFDAISPVSYSETIAAAFAIVDDARDESDVFLELVRDAPTGPETEQSLRAILGKEPTTAWDDFGSRALYGGVGDAIGSYNTYDGYADSHHFYFDAITTEHACVGATATVPAAGVRESRRISCNGYMTTYDPVSAREGERDSPSVILNFRGYAILWRDVNQDTHIGNVCNPSFDPASFDADRNTCAPATHPRPWPHKGDVGGEVIAACELGDGRGATFTLTPIGGAWPRVIIVREHQDALGLVLEQRVDVREDDAPIAMTWRETCASGGSGVPPYLESRDAILFPEGASVPIRVEAEVGIAGFIDTVTGTFIESERVRDVDIVPARL